MARSLQLIDPLFEDNFAAFMNHTVDNACKCENTSNDGAHADQELEEVLAHVGIFDCER